MTAPKDHGDLRILGIDHVVIVVRDLKRASATFEKLFGKSPEVAGGEAVGYEHAVFRCENGTQTVELCQPIEEDSPGGNSQASRAFRRRLATTGEGFHNLALTVNDLTAAKILCESSGFALIPSTNSDSVFIHPKEASGTLIQIWERSDG